NITEPILQQLAKFIIENNIVFPGVVGPSMSAELFSRIYCDLSGKNFKLGFGQKIYQNEKVVQPERIAGSMQTADESLTELIAKWVSEFTSEALPNEQNTHEQSLKLAVSKIKNAEVFVWIDENKTPVSMNFVGRPTQNGIGVSAVYTPMSFRKKGYASALVAATSQKMLDQGKKFCVLYTDLSNPTSNKIYQNIGYTEVAGSKQYLIMS
ncbi:MAG: GNAT family N-acetyltransferase, partial [Pseudobdellovibrio sp.]